MLGTGAVMIVRSAGSSASAPTPAKPLAVVSTSPASGATGVEANGEIKVRFSEPLAKGSPLPTLSPAVPGTWSRPDKFTAVFVPSADFVPTSQVTLTIPGGPAGVKSTDHTVLAETSTLSWTVQAGSTLRLQQLLALLGYLPVSWTPAAPSTPGPPSVDPQAGGFAWRWASTPPQLETLWQAGAPNVVTKGAVMAFESDHNLTTDGVAGSQVWAALLAADAAGQATTSPYNYVLVNQTLPQTLQVWQNGSMVATSPANTGISQSPTANGTWPVYEHLTSTTMSGTNPDGSHYSDSGVPWVSYFNGGDAIHGFNRAGYGYPQSLGCVELPYQDAQQVFPMTTIGTLVTVF